MNPWPISPHTADSAQALIIFHQHHDKSHGFLPIFSSVRMHVIQIQRKTHVAFSKRQNGGRKMTWPSEFNFRITRKGGKNQLHKRPSALYISQHTPHTHNNFRNQNKLSTMRQSLYCKIKYLITNGNKNDNHIESTFPRERTTRGIETFKNYLLIILCKLHRITCQLFITRT